MIKFDNIMKFVSVFLSGDLVLKYQSPDYIMEKFEKFLGKDIQIKKHSRTSTLYIKHNDIWKHDDYRINSIFNFLIDVLKYSKDSEVGVVPTPAMKNIRCGPDVYIELFESWIGDFSKIHNKDSLEGLHSILERNLYSLYLDNVDEQYSEFFLKLERKEKLKNIINYE